MLHAAAWLLPIFSMHWVTIQQLYRDTEVGKVGLAKGRVTIQTLYRGWGRLLYRNMAAIQAVTRLRCATTRRCGLQHARQCATWRARMALVLGVSRYSLRHGRPGLRHDRARPRHGRAWPATRRPVLHDTTQRAPRHGAVHAAWAQCSRPVRIGWVQGVHLVHPTQFWTQCTVSESLFRTLFMSTVHEVLKKIN